MALLVIYKHVISLAMSCYNLHPAEPEEDWPPLIAWFLSRSLPRFLPFWGVFPSHRALHLGFCIALCDIGRYKKVFINTFD